MIDYRTRDTKGATTSKEGAVALNILIYNTGSSTLKCSIVDASQDRRIHSHIAAWPPAAGGDVPPLPDLPPEANHLRIAAVAHRIVHGGPDYSGPTRLDGRTLQAIESASALAPLHNGPALSVVRAAMMRYPDLPQVAVFDTAFHHDLPAHARHYAVPAHWREQHGVRRFGFHGISHASVARQAATVLQRPLRELRLVTLHLGNGASAAAIAGGRSIDTSMGMTPMEGLVMGTRSGDLDIAAALLVARRECLSLDELEHVLGQQSGLAGLCGDSDLRAILARSEAGDTQAKLALAVYSYRIQKYIGAYMAVLGGLDALVFTGGVGENAAAVRASVCTGLEPFGIAVDCHENERHFSGQARMIHTAGAAVAVLVAPSDEDLEIARQTQSALSRR